MVVILTTYIHWEPILPVVYLPTFGTLRSFGGKKKTSPPASGIIILKISNAIGVFPIASMYGIYIYLHLPYVTIKNNQVNIPYMDGMGFDFQIILTNYGVNSTLIYPIGSIGLEYLPTWRA